MQLKDVTPIIKAILGERNKIPLMINTERYIPNWQPNLNGNAMRGGIRKALRAIEQAPVVDAVEVVRCRECEKFWEYTESHKATVEKADGDCMIRCMVAPDDPQFCAVQKDDYCSMGKRKGAKKDGGAEG